MIYPSIKQNKMSVLKMIPVGKAAFTKEFFYGEPKQYCFNKKATLTPDVKDFLTFFAPVNRARVITHNLHYFIRVSV